MATPYSDIINKIYACMFLPRKMLETAAKSYQKFGCMNAMKGSPRSLAKAVVYLFAILDNMFFKASVDLIHV